MPSKLKKLGKTLNFSSCKVDLSEQAMRKRFLSANEKALASSSRLLCQGAHVINMEELKI